MLFTLTHDDLTDDMAAALAELRVEQEYDAWCEAEAETIEEYLYGWELGCDEREDPWYGYDPVRF